MSAMKKRVVLKCSCCVDGCYEANGFDGRYYFGHTASDEGITDENSDGKIEWSTEDFERWRWKIKCHKLLVWNSIAVTSNTIPSSIGSPDHVLVSNGLYARSDISVGRVPFYLEGPGGSTELTSAPYWYSACRRGGWATTTIARIPTGTQLNTFWAGTVIPDGTYKLIACVRAWRYYKKNVGGGVDTITAVADGKFAVDIIAMQG